MQKKNKQTRDSVAADGKSGSSHSPETSVSSASVSEDGESEADHRKPPAEEEEVDDEIFRRVFKPIRSNATDSMETSDIQTDTAPQEKLQLKTSEESSSDGSLCLELDSDSSVSTTTSKSSLCPDPQVDEETFNRAFKRVSLVDPKDTQVALSLGCSQALSALQDQTKTMSITRESLLLEASSILSNQTPVTVIGDVPPTTPKQRKNRSHPKAKRSPLLNKFCNGSVPLRKTANSEITTPTPTGSRTSSPEKVAAAKAPTFPQVADPKNFPSNVLHLHTSDPQDDPSWNDSSATKALRRGIMFVKKGGRVCASWYPPDFTSKALTVNAILYSCSALGSASVLAALAALDPRPENLEKADATPEKVDSDEKPIVGEANTATTKRPKTVRKSGLSEVGKPAQNSTQEASPKKEDDADTVVVSRRGRTIKRTSRLSDYVVETSGIPAKKTGSDEKTSSDSRRQRTSSLDNGTFSSPEKAVRLSDGSSKTQPALPGIPSAKRSPKRVKRTNQRVPLVQVATGGNLVRTNDWGSTGSIDPFTSSGDEADPGEVGPLETKYEPPFGVSTAVETLYSNPTIPGQNSTGGRDQAPVESIAPIVLAASVSERGQPGTKRLCRSRAPDMNVVRVFNEEAHSESVYTTHIKQEPLPEVETTVLEPVYSNNPRPITIQPGVAAVSEVPLGGRGSGRGSVHIDPALGIDRSEEIEAIKDLVAVLYDKPHPIDVNQLMTDLRTSFCIELRNHEQLLRWKKFLTMRNLQLRSKLVNVRKYHKRHCSIDHSHIPQGRPEGEGLPPKTPSSSERSSTLRQILQSGFGFGQPVTVSQPSSASEGSSRRKSMYDFSHVKIAKAAPSSAPNDIGDSAPTLSKPPSLVVHPISASASSVVPISPIIPAGQAFPLPPSMRPPASAYIPKPHGAEQRIGNVASAKAKIVLKPIGGKLAGAPPRIIRRLIPISRAPIGQNVVTPLPVPQVVKPPIQARPPNRRGRPRKQASARLNGCKQRAFIPRVTLPADGELIANEVGYEMVGEAVYSKSVSTGNPLTGAGILLSSSCPEQQMHPEGYEVMPPPLAPPPKMKALMMK